MIIAIDGYEANVESRVGISRYAHSLLTYIHEEVRSKRLKVKNNLLDFRIYLPSEPLIDMPKETSWWRYKIVGPKRLWTIFRLPLSILTDTRADVIFSPTHYIPRFISTPRVMTIMDVSFLHYPELFKKEDLYKLTKWTAYSVTHAKKILTISEFSKNAIINAYSVPGDRIVVTYPGIRELLASTMTKEELIKKYNISAHFILSVGTIQPRKNYVRLIEAFSHFLKQNKQKFGDISLVIVGKKGWLYEDIFDCPKLYGIADKVIFLNFIPDSDLPSLYTHALCFALPSLYEGFGLPVLEAMSYKCPVVVSQVSSLPEIAGEAGVYVDPENIESITQGLLTAVRQRNLLQGKRRIHLGLEQTKKFTWESAAQKTLAVLEEVGRSNP